MKGNDYRNWVKYARNDLSVAIREMERNVNPRHRPLEVILYHCQQTAEKMLKAYLIYNGTSVFSGSKAWGHDLNVLRTNCSSIDSDFSGARITGHCAYLSAFANVKYPDFTLSIDSSHAKRGLNSAKRIYEFISVKLGIDEFP